MIGASLFRLCRPGLSGKFSTDSQSVLDLGQPFRQIATTGLTELPSSVTCFRPLLLILILNPIAHWFVIHEKCSTNP